MIVRAPATTHAGDQLILAAALEFERSGRAPFELRFGIPAALAASADTTANPFLPLATLIAARTGEDLRLEAPASPRLVAGARKAAAMFAEWWDYRPPEVDPAGGEEVAPGGEGVGIMYSRGVDSGAVLVRSLRGQIPERVTHLLSGDGIEWCYSREIERQIWADHERAAAELGLPLVRLTSNARELLRGMIGWPRSFGMAYIGAALALGPMLGNVVTGATQPLAGAAPRGSRWDLDPLWSTEGTAVRQDGAELDRIQRTAIVASHDVSVRWLKVCWQGRTAGNCGRCLKCLRTMTALAAAGVLDHAELFDAPLTAEAIDAAEPEKLGVPLGSSIVESVPPDMPEIRAAWERKVAADARARRRRAREERHAARLAPLRRTPRIARRRVRRLRRRLRRRAGRLLGSG